MASSIPLQLAETIQTAHINHNPSVARDLAPSTAADVHEPIVLETLDDNDDDHDGDADQEDDNIDDVDDGDYDEAQYSVIRAWDPFRDRRGAVHGTPFAGSRYLLPPLPDLRFEQSYLRSLSSAQGSWWKIALITMRDQVLMPLAQGLAYNVVLLGWQYWNRNAVLSGQSVGARVRRWWYVVNNWPLPPGVAKI